MLNELTRNEMMDVSGGCICGAFAMTDGQWFDVPSLPGGTTYVKCNNCSWHPCELAVYCYGVHTETLDEIGMVACKPGAVMTVQSKPQELNAHIAWVSVPSY